MIEARDRLVIWVQDQVDLAEVWTVLVSSQAISLGERITMHQVRVHRIQEQETKRNDTKQCNVDQKNM